MPRRRPLKMSLPARPRRVQVVVVTPDMVPPRCGMVILITRDAADDLGLTAGEERNCLRFDWRDRFGLRAKTGHDIALVRDVGNG